MQSDVDVVELLSTCAATSINAISTLGPGEDAQELARAVQLEMRNYWTIAPENFLRRVAAACTHEFSGGT
jgi:hypothetical protein